MNTAQFLAADPKVSAWVAASAGTGKTKVLTDRILNLLLQGFAPERILCLTFTKAAAAEMANRLMNRLAQWVALSEFDLSQELKVLVGEGSISPQLYDRARQLFSLVLDAPGGMKVQTIHGFCQSVLGRFPLEAGIPPHFRILDDVLSEEVLLEAQHRVFAKPSPIIERALDILNPYMADQRFASILKDIYSNRSRVGQLLARYDNFEGYVQELIAFLEVGQFAASAKKLLEPDLISCLKLQFAPTERDFDGFVNMYLTQKREIRKKLSPEQIPEAERVFKFVRSLSALEVAQRTVATLSLFEDIMQEYQDQKSRQGVLDYDDLIQKTQNLLSQPGIAAWVLYKLDGGIDHLLIDEAQDTNAAQWEIILRLTSEFFTQDNTNRTIFAVGDAKQSIYSFQGANPHDFLKLKDHFATLTQNIGQKWRDVQLDLSYRSTAAILGIVDEVFANDQTKQGVLFDRKEIVHQVFREVSRDHLPGLVELWPLVEREAEIEKANDGEWQLPLQRVERRSPQYCLAQFLAEQVANWITSKGILPSTNQPIQPRDILILVRKRSALGEEIIRALKKRNIPVAGSDRLVVTDYIAVMDLLSLGQFVLLPEDDLSLACVLRSPLIGMSEDDLFTIAHEREGTLWASLSQKASSHPSFEVAYRWLKSCLHESDLSPVYEFYNWVLIQGEGRRRFLSRLGQEAEDVIEEFLTQCLKYDQEHASSLQGFVHFMSHHSQEIKRDSSDTVHNQVRLMTVHGSKGLQAPIVILPDAAEAGKERWDPLLWDENLVMLRPSQSQDTDKTCQLKDKGAYRAAEEKRRLLYVALTRAQDRLYVGGWTSGKELPQDSWYRLIQHAVEQKSGTNSYYHDDHQSIDEHGTRQNDSHEKGCDLPSWALNRPTGLVQKRTELEEKRSLSGKAIERGVLIHRFFEYLPQFAQDRRYMAACQVLEKERLSLSDWEEDIQATLHILNDPAFKDLFGPDSLAEVPISGMVGETPFQGRIDRLVVTEDTLTIVDYKTNRDPPTKVEDIPEAYIKQLEGYATALRSIYPNHHIRKILLWTAGPKIQVVS